MLHFANSISVQWEKHHFQGMACSLCHSVYVQPHDDNNNSLHLLPIYSVLHISQMSSYLSPINLRGRDSAHFTDEATEDQRKNVTSSVS